MNRKNILIVTLFLSLVILLMNIISAAHYIVGIVEDAKDGTSSNDHTILLWNPSVGIFENLTDLIGPNGNSHVNNIYMIDCELLPSGCNIGENLTLKVINNGENYISEEKNVTVTGAGYDLVSNITLNSPPDVGLIFPYSFANISSSEINFNCSIFDFDLNLKEASLYGTWDGGWNLNETKGIISEGGFITFNKNLLEGLYEYNCMATDNLLTSSFATENITFTIDLTKPNIESIFVNSTYSCGQSNFVRVNCTTYDTLLNVDKVIIQTISPSETKNYTASLLTSNTYYSDILLDEVGGWTFNCISNDTAGNVNNLTSQIVNVFSNSPELYINFTTIRLSEEKPIENQEIKINAVIENFGCSIAENVLVSFFEGDPSESGDNIYNYTLNISSLSAFPANISWIAKIGPNNIFVIADYDNKINEENETNNKANNTFSINAWQDIYGNISLDKIIGGDNISIKKWFNESQLEGHVFITDSECEVDWLSLQALGKSKSGEDSSNDFLEIDEVLNMINFEDSISNVFSDNQNPKNTKNMLIYQKEIENVPVIKSTNNSNFITGLLWDFSDDREGENGEFDTIDKEDIVFVAEVNKSSEGNYGLYDYEIKIPSRLREYNNLDNEEVYLYYNLN